jgi:DNA invertase Pin-like site-specific DNA recombinase
LEKTYSDEGLSGTKKKNRKAFLRMLEDAEEKKFDYLLVKDISRLARNIIDSIETIRFLKRHIQKVIFINQPNLTDDEFVLGIMGLIAQQESENMSKRVKFGKRINMEKGKVPNVVYGYDKVILTCQ